MGLFRRSKRSAAAVAGDVAAIPAPPSTAWITQTVAPAPAAAPTTASAAPVIEPAAAAAPLATVAPVAVAPVAPPPSFSYGGSNGATVAADTPDPSGPRAPDVADVADAADAIAAVVADELSAIVARLDQLEIANTQLRTTVDQVTSANTQLRATVDQVNAANTELLATVHRLEARLDTPLDAPSIDAPAIATVDDLAEIRAGQVRLANEQARYEIAFRADLADLAERLRRSA